MQYIRRWAGLEDICRPHPRQERLEDRWNPDLDEWFEDGAETPGVVMILVKAEKVHYWEGREGGEVKL
jgi:general stress protein 26